LSTNCNWCLLCTNC